MKTIDKVQKAVLKSLVLITGFVLIGFTVAAQDLGKSINQNKENNELALATVERRIELQPASPGATTTDVSSSTSFYTTESEYMLEVEEWMTNEDIFFSKQYQREKEMISTSNTGYGELIESRLVFENWMFNLNYWTINR